MTLKQACEYLSISEATGRNWIKQGRLTPDHFDRQKRSYFTPDSIKKLKENLQQSGKLTKRRNKTAIRLSSAYTNYLDCDEDTARQLKRIVAYCQEKEAPLINTIAHYAREFFRSVNTLQKYTPLLEDLLALAPGREELSDYPPLRFRPYEDLLGYLYISLTQLDRRKKSGIYYTPSRLVKRLIDRTSQYAGDINIFFDPACGTGNFLLQILSYTEKNDKSFHKKSNKKIRLTGQDTDSAAVAIARINIALNSPKTEIDALRKNIRTADSLLEFPTCKDTLIFGNPPWGAQLSSRDYSGVKDSAALFVQNSIQHQSDNGVISFLLPASLLTAGKHREMRKMLLEHTQIISVDYLTQSFTLVNCPSVILTLQKSKRQPGVRRCNVYKKTEQYTIHNRSINNHNINNPGNPSLCTTPSADYLPMLHADDDSYALFCKLGSLNHTVNLKGAAEFAIGIVTGDNERFLIPPGKSNHASVPITDTEEPSGKEPAHIAPEPIIRGFNLCKYRLRGPFDRIRYTPEAFQQCAKEDFYRAREKLLYRFIGKTPVFSYDDHGYLTLNSCNILIPRINGLEIKYILAVLNSDIAAFYWRIGFDSVKLLKSHIEALPIPIASAAKQRRIISLVDKILTDEQNYDIIRNDIEEEISRLYELTATEHSLIQNQLLK